MKCSLQEFQHMFPQLTSCIKNRSNSSSSINNNLSHHNHDTSSSNIANIISDQQHDLHFYPMECPILPLDTTFKCKDMMHEEFCVNEGPLWRVQLIDESTMDLANLRFGPELSALLEDTTAEISVRWRYFLRYQQGSVNQVIWDECLTIYVSHCNVQLYKICTVSYSLALLRLTFRNTTRMKRVKEVLY